MNTMDVPSRAEEACFSSSETEHKDAFFWGTLFPVPVFSSLFPASTLPSICQSQPPTSLTTPLLETFDLEWPGLLFVAILFLPFIIQKPAPFLWDTLAELQAAQRDVGVEIGGRPLLGDGAEGLTLIPWDAGIGSMGWGAHVQ